MRLHIGIVCVGLVIHILPEVAPAQEDVDTNTIVSETMRKGCIENPEWSESWVSQKIKPFLPADDAPSLRLESLQELEAQTDLAIGSIKFHCRDYHAGKLSRHYWDLQIKANEEQISEFERQLGEAAIGRANQGVVSDIDDIRAKLIQVLGVGRQAELMGMDSRGLQAQQIATNTLSTFSAAVQATCDTQSFDPDIALALERQNELAGTKVDLHPCALRKFALVVGPMYLLESCSLHGFGTWRLTWPMSDPPIQTESAMDMVDNFHGDGTFKALWNGAYGVSYQAQGDMHLTRKDNRDKKTGKLLERHYHMSGDWKMALVSGQDKINRIMQLTTAKHAGGQGKYDQEVEFGEKPCKSVDTKPPPGG